MNELFTKTIYRLHDDGVTGYCFDAESNKIFKRYKGQVTEVLPNTEEMGRANDSLTSMSGGYGMNMSMEITKEKYLLL